MPDHAPRLPGALLQAVQRARGSTPLKLMGPLMLAAKFLGPLVRPCCLAFSLSFPLSLGLWRIERSLGGRTETTRWTAMLLVLVLALTLALPVLQSRSRRPLPGRSSPTLPLTRLHPARFLPPYRSSVL